MKKLLLIITFMSAGIGTLAFAQQGGWAGYWSSPLEVVDSVVGEANKNIQFQETALDGITDQQGGFVRQYKIANTLDYLRNNIAPYLQWLVYIGLVIAVILIVYNGFLMVTHAFWGEGDFAKMKKRIGYIAIGVLLMTGFYAIIRLVIGLINSIFGTNGSGSTWF